MTRFALPLSLLLPLLLGGCGMFQARPPAQSAMDNEACRAEAIGSPDVREVARRANADNPELMARLRVELADARFDAYRRCLRARGLPAPGGVEPIRPAS